MTAKRNARTRRARGFTLLELMMVIALIVMLGGLAIGLYVGQFRKSQEKITKQLVQEVSGHIERYHLDIGHYPNEQEGGIKALMEKPDFGDNEALGDQWAGPYIKQLPKDAWGRELHYDPEVGEDSIVPFKLWSEGRDGQSETDDDIRNWSEEKAG